ncbi:nickel-dependent hydrogenase large subunit [Bradyrhizobium xenonodulans]|uniref:Nickel-dependent hydrogenase large subunit n=1 Tax=Bradyrhizobium xenonodulans TaxID=2736875 RepID=A0ABY7MIF4_9BRAD|nr:nickel-dependent hydrogenase large subunit [Bradyrhizobium xenonodulans]WBL77731.1 nickel-dependent hydrogenase large subunit [Bradyrhizobium xenonodulans]
MTLPSSALIYRCNKDSKKQASRSGARILGKLRDVSDLNRPIHSARRDRDSEKRNNSICSWQRGLREAYRAIRKYLAEVVRELTSPAICRKQRDAKQPAGSHHLPAHSPAQCRIEQPFCHNSRETPDDAYVGSRPRTAARHWMAVGDGRIERYQINAPTTWNFSPRISFDADGPL